MVVRTDSAEFVSNIPALRRQIGMTQRELSLELDVTEATVQNWESGRVGATQIHRVLQLCELLACQVTDLVESTIVPDAEGIPIVSYTPVIQAVRKRQGLKQRQIAIALAVTERTIKAWEKGEAGLDVIVRMIQLCQLFNCDATALICRKTDEA